MTDERDYEIDYPENEVEDLDDLEEDDLFAPDLDDDIPGLGDLDDEDEEDEDEE